MPDHRGFIHRVHSTRYTNVNIKVLYFCGKRLLD
jgi:hypothetical protein